MACTPAGPAHTVGGWSAEPSAPPPRAAKKKSRLLDVVIVLVIIVVLFGGAKLPQLAKGLGEGIREFKKAQREVAADDHKDDEKKS